MPCLGAHAGSHEGKPARPDVPPLPPSSVPQQVESTCIHTDYIVNTYREMPPYCGKWRAGPGKACVWRVVRSVVERFFFLLGPLPPAPQGGGRTDIRVSYRCKPRVRASIRSGHAAAPWFRDVRPESDSCCFCQGPIIRRSDSDGVRGRRVITVGKRRARLQNTAVTRSPPTSQANSRVETERPSLGFLRGIMRRRVRRLISSGRCEVGRLWSRDQTPLFTERSPFPQAQTVFRRR